MYLLCKLKLENAWFLNIQIDIEKTMALWKILVITAVLTVMSTECKASAFWWQRLFEGTGSYSDSSDSADTSTRWTEDYAEDDNLEWEDNQADRKALSG